MRDARHHRHSRAARLALCAGGAGAVWAGGVLFLGAASDARADDGALSRGTGIAVGVLGTNGTPTIDVTPPIVDSLTSGSGLPSVLGLPDLPDIPDLPDLPDVTEVVDLPGLPELPTVSLPPVVPELPAVPTIPVTPTLPSLPPGSVLDTPSVELPLPSEAVPASGADAQTPPPLGSGAPPARPDDPIRTTSWVLDTPPVTPPPAPTPPSPSQVASNSSSVAPPASADRVSSPRAHFDSFLNTSPPGRGPPRDLAQDVATSPD